MDCSKLNIRFRQLRTVGLLLSLYGWLGCSAPVGAQALSTWAGGGAVDNADGIPALDARLMTTGGLAAGAGGNLYISEGFFSHIFKVDASGVISMVAGTGTPGFSGDGGLAVSAQINTPSSLALDAEGNLFFYDSLNHRIRRVDTSGVITTVAGNGVYGYAGDGALAVDASLRTGPLAVHGRSLYVADSTSFVVRKVDLDTGLITTVVGDGVRGVYGEGDGGAATAARLYMPKSLATDGDGNLYILDGWYYYTRIRKVDAATGIITTIAGGTMRCPLEVDPDPRSAMIYTETYSRIAVDSTRNLFVDIGCRIYRLDLVSNVLTHIAGWAPGYGGDGGEPIEARFSETVGELAVDAAGTLYVADHGNRVVRKLTNASVLVPPAMTPTVTPAPAETLRLVKSVDPPAARPGDTVTYCLSVQAPPGSAMVDIVWVIDRTGSMSGVFDGIRDNISQFTGTLSGAGLDYRQGLIAFEDWGLAINPADTYGFASSDAEFLGWIDGITLGAGDDIEENQLETVLAAAAYPFRSGARRVIILITDAPVRTVELGGTHTIPEVAALLRADGILYYSICSDTCFWEYANPVWLASQAGGVRYALGEGEWHERLASMAKSIVGFFDVTVREPLPSGLTLPPGGYPGWTLSGDELRWNIPQVPFGTSVTRCFSSIVSAAGEGAIVNQAFVSVGSDVERAGNEVSLEILPPYTATATPSWTPTETPSPTSTGTPTPTPSSTPDMSLRLWPNPYNPATAVGGTLKCHVMPTGSSLSVYTVSGEKVFSAMERNGRVEWDGITEKGKPVAPGLYYFKVLLGKELLHQGVLLVKDGPS